jgi:long-chain acyl-CoA synthetase
MSTYAERPWQSLYRPGQPVEVEAEFPHLLAMWADAVRRAPDQDAIRYFDATLSVAQLDAASDALAAGLQERGFAPGDRLAIFSQNDPAFVIAMLATWKAGGVAVSVNPMYKERELGHVLADSGARALVCLDEVHPVAAAVLAAGSDVDIVVTFSGRDLQTRDDERVLDQEVAPVAGTEDLLELLERHAGQRPAAVPAPSPETEAFLVYTSGTTGDPKGARLTHANFVATRATTGSGWSSAPTTRSWPSRRCSTSPGSSGTACCRCCCRRRWSWPTGSTPR